MKPVSLVGALVVVATGCTAKFEPSVKVSALEAPKKEGSGDKIDAIKIEAHETDLKTRVTRVQVDGKTSIDSGYLGSAMYAAADFPVGKTKAKVVIEGSAKGMGRSMKPVTYTTEVEIDRKPLAPRLLAAGGLGCSPLKERVCLASPDAHANGQIHVYFTGPAGTKVEYGDHKVTLPELPSPLEARIDVSKRILSVPVDGEMSIPVKITSPDGITESKTATATFRDGLREAIKTNPHGPLQFFDEPSKVGPSKVVAGITSSGVVKIFGKGKLEELELVAEQRRLHARKQSCGTYVGQTSGRHVTIENVAYDVDVNVYERKTGRLTQTKHFAANMPACAGSISSEYTGVKGEVDQKTLDAFVESLVVK